MDVDEEAAKKYPYPEHPLNGAWAPRRRLDGTTIRP
jgi:mannonate dehydratase